MRPQRPSTFHSPLSTIITDRSLQPVPEPPLLGAAQKQAYASFTTSPRAQPRAFDWGCLYSSQTMPERAADNDSEAARAAMCANMEGRMMLWDGGGRLPRQRSTRPGNSAARPIAGSCAAQENNLNLDDNNNNKNPLHDSSVQFGLATAAHLLWSARLDAGLIFRLVAVGGRCHL